MNDEAAFQSHLDAHPDDHVARLVFADWLQERGDPRAEGYRAIARLPQPDCRTNNGDKYPFIWMKPCIATEHGVYAPLPSDWLDQLKGSQFWFDGRPVRGAQRGEWKNYSTRRQAEDAAALAFAKLPEHRRAELLRQEVPA